MLYNNKKIKENMYEYTIDIDKYCKSLSLESIDPKFYIKRNINFDAISLEMLDEQFYSLEGLKDIFLKIGQFAKKIFDFILNLLINLKNKVKNFYFNIMKRIFTKILNSVKQIYSTEENIEDYNLGNLDMDLTGYRDLVLFKFIKDNPEDTIEFLFMEKEEFLEILFSSFPSGENQNFNHQRAIKNCNDIVKELISLNNSVADYNDLPSQREKQLSDYEIKGDIEWESKFSNAYHLLKKYFGSDFPKHEIDYKENLSTRLKEKYNINFQIEKIVPDTSRIEQWLHIKNHDLRTSKIFQSISGSSALVHLAIEQHKKIEFLINIFREFAKLRNSKAELKEFESQAAFKRFMKFLTAVAEYSNEILKLRMNIVNMIKNCMVVYIREIFNKNKFSKENPIKVNQKTFGYPAPGEEPYL